MHAPLVKLVDWCLLRWVGSPGEQHASYSDVDTDLLDANETPSQSNCTCDEAVPLGEGKVRGLNTYFRTVYFAQAFFSVCMVVEDSCFVPVPTHNIKYRFKFKSKHLGNHGRANVHLIDQ